MRAFSGYEIDDHGERMEKVLGLMVADGGLR